MAACAGERSPGRAAPRSLARGSSWPRTVPSTGARQRHRPQQGPGAASGSPALSAAAGQVPPAGGGHVAPEPLGPAHRVCGAGASRRWHRGRGRAGDAQPARHEASGAPQGMRCLAGEAARRQGRRASIGLVQRHLETAAPAGGGAGSLGQSSAAAWQAGSRRPPPPAHRRAS